MSTTPTPDPPQTPKRDTVICTCKHKCGPQGKPVHKSTRTVHRNKDIAAAAKITGSGIATTQTPPPPTPAQHTMDIVDDSINQSNLNNEPTSGCDGEPSAKRENIASVTEKLWMVVCSLAAWLYLVAGLSRASTNRVMKVIDIAVQLSIKLGTMRAASDLTGSSHEHPPPLSLRLPHDVRTAIGSLGLEPKIIRTICCPKCFKQYSLGHIPQTCDFRRTLRSRVCGEELWASRNTTAGPCIVPCQLYCTQDFESWLEYFLRCPGIEDEIEKSYNHRRSTAEMKSVWDSPAWRSLGSFTTTRGNLTFTYFIDWFNPLSNKIAGKTVSAGAIMFFCLNLPPHLQHRPEYTFFAGITPLPKEPNMETITAVSDPVVRQFERFWNGCIVRTRHHPDGILRRVAVLAAIGDLLAIRKALGYAGVASNKHFCSFCNLHKDNIEELDIRQFTYRVGTDVRCAAEEWRMATTIKRREQLFKENGVRWSSLHHLVYRDPVRHTILGLMHNWIEGILQHHVRKRWGIGSDGLSVVTGTEESDQNLDMIIDDDDAGMDVDMINAEILGLQEESEFAKNNPSQALPFEGSLWDMNMDSILEDDDEDGDFEPNEDNDDEDGDGDEEPESRQEILPQTLTFTAAQLSSIRECIANTTIPSWIERPPSNLGEKTHGKLKADQWLKLFIVFLPLILPEIWTQSASHDYQDLLDNFYSLVTCTNLVCAYSVSNDSADLYLHHYIKYRASSQVLFPHAPSRPNHHFAMHNAELMKFWGPLIWLSEFPYEQHNGTLQRIKTNGHLWEMDLTMLRQICRRGRVTALLESEASNSDSNDISRILLQDDRTRRDPTGSSATVEMRGGTFGRLSEQEYAIWLQHANSHLNKYSPNGQYFRAFNDLTHPDDANVLPAHTSFVKHIYLRTRLYSIYSIHQGNSSISFDDGTGVTSAGFIQRIWIHELASIRRTFILVAPHVRLSPKDSKRNPYSQLPGLKADLVYAQKSLVVSQWVLIENSQVIGHVPFYRRPRGTFGIKQATVVLINSLHREHNRD